MNKKSKFLLLLVSVSIATSCKTTGSKTLSDARLPEPMDLISHIEKVKADEHFSGLSGETEALWKAYEERENRANLVDTCPPLHYSPVSKDNVEGLVVIYHGFTGCPIQFKNLAEILAQEGYHVFLPLSPGQGRKLQTKTGPFGREYNEDDLTMLPTKVDGYVQHEKEINWIFASTDTYKVIGGLSGGGAIAAGIFVEGQSSNKWNKAIFYVPFFKIPGAQGVLANVASIAAPMYRNSWGADCVNDQKIGTRNGICSFTGRHIKAVVDYGARYAKRLGESGVPVQIVAVDEDGSSDAQAIIDAMEGIFHNKKNLCFYGKEVGHAIVYSRDVHVEVSEGSYELQIKDPTYPWSPDVYLASRDFIKNGNYFPTQKASDGSEILSSEATYKKGRPEVKKCFYDLFKP